MSQQFRILFHYSTRPRLLHPLGMEQRQRHCHRHRQSGDDYFRLHGKQHQRLPSRSPHRLPLNSLGMANPSLPIRPLALQLSRQRLRRRRIPAQPAARPPRCPCPVRVDFLSRTCPNREGRPPAAQCHCFSQLLRPRRLNRLHDSGTQSLQHTMYQQSHRSPWADRPARRQPRSILRQHPCPTQRNV